MRLRLIASFLILVFVAIGVFVVVTIRQNAQEVRNFVNKGGLTGREQVVSVLEEYYRVNRSWDGVGNVLRRAPQVPRRGMWGLPPGRGFGQGPNAELPKVDLLLVDADGTLVANSREGSLTRVERLSPADLSRAVVLQVDGETVGYLLNEAGEVFTVTTQISLLSRLNQAAVVAVVIAGGVAVILALVLSYSLVRPVRALQQAASRLARGDLSHRVQVKGNDELASLGRTFNHMAESLQHAEESRRAMTADIAHELRTPLAVQRAHLEAIEDGVYPLTPERLEIIEEQNHLLTRLVEDLRMLALADAGKLELQHSQVNFPGIVRQVAARFEIQASERGVDLHLSLGDCPPLWLDPQRIQQILHNILHNALRYTPDGGEIQINLSVQDSLPPGSHRGTAGGPTLSASGSVHLDVRDSGPGIPPEALPHIFDRFYRAEKSRARVEGGTGLGLSIARKLAQAHGGNLTAANHPQGGAVLTLSLPISGAV